MSQKMSVSNTSYTFSKLQHMIMGNSAFTTQFTRSENTFLQSGSSSRRTVSSRRHRRRCKDSRKNSKDKWEAKEIPREVVMELFDIHNNRTPQRYFEEFIPLYPKSSSLLFTRYKPTQRCESFYKEWFQRAEKSSYRRLITKAFIECDAELRAFSKVNKLNEYPMIAEAVKQERPRDILMEDLLLFFTNIGIRDILKLKKGMYQVWTEDNTDSLTKSNKDNALEVENLYVPENKEMSSSNSSDTDSVESCEVEND